MKTAKKIDREIKKRVRAVESDIPPALEKAFLEKLEGIEPGKIRPREKRFVYYGVLAAAASLLLAVLLLLFPLFHQQIENGTADAQEVLIQDPRVEGVPASTFIINPKDPDITIIWVEKNKK
jgi:hypothetical protein